LAQFLSHNYSIIFFYDFTLLTLNFVDLKLNEQPEQNDQTELNDQKDLIVKFPTYVYIAPQQGVEGAGYVLMTKPPYCLGKIVTSKNEEDYEKFLKHHDLPVGKVTGYRVCIIYAGTLNDMTEGIGDLKIMQNMLDAMADWYFQNRIKEKTGKFFRFVKNAIGFFTLLILPIN